MALPGHRRTSSHKRRRASHFALKQKQYVSCSNCSSPTMPHIACWQCGFYKGKKVFDTKKSLAGLEKAAVKADAAEAKKTVKKAAEKKVVAKKTVKKAVVKKEKKTEVVSE